MKIKILDTNGKETNEIAMPKFFSAEIRDDIVGKILEAKKIEHPYAPSPVAGKQHSASGIINHRRHVWKTSYGRGMSRVPRKIMSRRGTQFNWVGAMSPNTAGGRRAHPPKVVSKINTSKINKKEMKIAILSALSATASTQKIAEKYSTIDEKEMKIAPFIVETKITKLKVKELLSSLKKILGEKLFSVAIPKKKVRSGQGKRRGRKYKSNAGVLIVVGNEEKIKTSAVEVISADRVGIFDLAKGGQGRLTIYTENAISDLNKKMDIKNEA